MADEKLLFDEMTAEAEQELAEGRGENEPEEDE